MSKIKNMGNNDSTEQTKRNVYKELSSKHPVKSLVKHFMVLFKKAYPVTFHPKRLGILQ